MDFNLEFDPILIPFAASVIDSNSFPSIEILSFFDKCGSISINLLYFIFRPLSLNK
jgi:hypothetical protein